MNTSNAMEKVNKNQILYLQCNCTTEKQTTKRSNVQTNKSAAHIYKYGLNRMCL